MPCGLPGRLLGAGAGAVVAQKAPPCGRSGWNRPRRSIARVWRGRVCRARPRPAPCSASPPRCGFPRDGVRTTLRCMNSPSNSDATRRSSACSGSSRAHHTRTRGRAVADHAVRVVLLTRMDKVLSLAPADGAPGRRWHTSSCVMRSHLRARCDTSSAHHRARDDWTPSRDAPRGGQLGGSAPGGPLPVLRCPRVSLHLSPGVTPSSTPQPMAPGSIRPFVQAGDVSAGCSTGVWDMVRCPRSCPAEHSSVQEYTWLV
jgi:hypothetical protein